MNFLGITDEITEIYKQYQKHGVGKNGKISKADGNDFKYMREAIVMLGMILLKLKKLLKYIIKDYLNKK